MPTAQCFCREQLPQLFTTGPRAIADGRNYGDSHSITYSLARPGKTSRIWRRVVFKTFSDVAAVLISRTPGVTQHEFDSARIDSDTFGVHSRQVVSAVLGYELHSQE